MAEKLIPRATNFSEWYVDLVLKAQLADYSDVKGCMVIRPNGYAIWENMQRVLDRMFKETGHRNAYFPLFIRKEAEHVEGFAPQLAVVTHAGGKKLEEPLVIRPTSETIVNSAFARWIQSYRDLPMLINQWVNVMRWEMRTRLFLRTSEFLWQEGHTCHETEEEAQRETLQMLEVYRTFAEQYMAMPVLAGQNFAKAFNTTFQGRDGKQSHVWQTSWGVSTRLVGALVMTHSDDSGLIVPPRLAADHVVIVVIGKGPEERAPIQSRAEALAADLRKAGLGVLVDNDETKGPGFKFYQYELVGVCLRIELGPKDIAKEQCVVVRRDNRQKELVPLAGAVTKVKELLESMQQALFAQAQKLRDENTFEVNSLQELKARADDGFLLVHWCERPECEAKIKEETGATSRCRPFNLKQEKGSCVVCGQESPGRMVFAKAY